MNRRFFIKVSALAGGGILLRCQPDRPETVQTAHYSYNPYVSIANDGRVIIAIPVPEIGQGVRTSLAMLVAEELEFPWEEIEVIQADGGDLYEGSDQRAAGSNSIKVYWEPMRKAGATAREMLIMAAARRWNSAPYACYAYDSDA